MLVATLALASIALVLGGLLGFAARRFRPRGNGLADAIERLLPQTQCAQCGYAGCRPYAAAIARGDADIDRCPPGGAGGVRALALLLGRDAKPVDPARGVTKPPQAVVVDESRCIGCTKCIDACPVDAIVGAPKRMHAVIADECTGCELCLPPCPVDCIVVVPRDDRARSGRSGADVVDDDVEVGRAAAGGDTARLPGVGPLMGIAPPNDAIAVTQTTNRVLVPGHDVLSSDAPEMPCIRCGECVRVCPANLLPQQLDWYIRAGDLERVREHALADCIECGRCAVVCPSRIPLVAGFRRAKRDITLADAGRAAAERARQRHATLSSRRLAQEAEHTARLAARTVIAGGERATDDPIAAAVARAAAKRGAPPDRA